MINVIRLLIVLALPFIASLIAANIAAANGDFLLGSLLSATPKVTVWRSMIVAFGSSSGIFAGLLHIAFYEGSGRPLTWGALRDAFGNANVVTAAIIATIAFLSSFDIAESAPRARLAFLWSFENSFFWMAGLSHLPRMRKGAARKKTSGLS
ncbi:MAG: hypothetical protein WC700_02340 [Gemmatimonadaceae bacterium]|jgi:hypothetical protein